MQVFKDKKTLIESLPIAHDTLVLDIGFTGQATTEDDPTWPHRLLQLRSRHVYGLDIALDPTRFPPPRYLQASAEDFSFPHQFDLIFAGDVIEHLSNPGLFLQCCMRNLRAGGMLVLTTPNAFNWFTLVEKLTHDEPNVNPDHTLYFNTRVLVTLFKKNGISSYEFGYLYTLGATWKGGIKRWILASVYALLSRITPKFLETLVVTVRA